MVIDHGAGVVLGCAEWVAFSSCGSIHSIPVAPRDNNSFSGCDAYCLTFFLLAGRDRTEVKGQCMMGQISEDKKRSCSAIRYLFSETLC